MTIFPVAVDFVRACFPSLTVCHRVSTAGSRQLLHALLYLPTSLWVAGAVYLALP
jgi:hypothetical protein